MSFLLSPIGNGAQFFTTTGLPLNGGYIYTYQAGSTTPANTYTTSAGTIANTNPIQLGTDGRPPQEIWLTDGSTYKFVLTDSNNVVIQTYDNLYGIIGTTPSVSAVPAGGIIMWAGSIASIPSGYVICDGTNGTPDLRDRFVVGAGTTYAVTAIGGSADAIVVQHTHTATSTSVVTDPGHYHGNAVSSYQNPATTGGASPYGGPGNTTTKTTGITVATTTTNANTGVSGTNANLPPYYALAYIMKG